MPSLNTKNTELIFWSNSYQTSFEAVITEISNLGIVLDKTLFYPIGGGQSSDQGIIYLLRDEKIRYRVISVEKINGKIYHKLNEETRILKIGDKIKGNIDWEKRYNLMKAHSSQHIISAIIANKIGVQTIKALIEESIVTIYLEKEITHDDIYNALIETNEILNKNLEITTKNIPRIELKKNQYNHLRGHIEEIDADIVRIVSVKGVDDSLCGGTHCRTTSEIGFISLVDFKGDILSYIFGKPAIQNLVEMDLSMICLAKKFASKKVEVPKRIEKTLFDYEETKATNLEIIKELVKLKMKEIKNNAILFDNFSIFYHDFHYAEKRFVLQELGPLPENSVAFFITKGPILVVSSSNVSIPANKLISIFNEKTSNKGGGSPLIAQTSISNIDESIGIMLEIIKKINKNG